MMSSLSSLRRDQNGVALVEFALIAPLLIGMMVAVLQIGVSMQSYNALRSISSDTARFAIVEYQKKNKITNESVEQHAKTLGTGPRYNLKTSLAATVNDAAVQDVDGAIRKELTLRYTPPAFLPIIPYTSPNLVFTRPIYVIDE